MPSAIRHAGPLALALAAGVVASPGTGAADIFVCGEGSRSFVVAGDEGAPGCDRVAEPQTELQLSPEEPDLEALLIRLAEQGRRLDRLERYVFGAQARRSVRPSFRPSADPFDTRGRTRDLGQDIDRSLDELSR